MVLQETMQGKDAATGMKESEIHATEGDLNRRVEQMELKESA